VGDARAAGRGGGAIARPAGADPARYVTGVYALASSGGKDSTLALDRAVWAGIQVRYLVNLYDAATGRVAFHGVRRELIERQAHQLGLEPVMRAVESGRFEDEFGRAL